MWQCRKVLLYGGGFTSVWSKFMVYRKDRMKGHEYVHFKMSPSFALKNREKLQTPFSTVCIIISLLQDNLSPNSCIIQTFVWMATWWNVGWFLSPTETSWKRKIVYQLSYWWKTALNNASIFFSCVPFWLIITWPGKYVRPTSNQW